jgi:hypothetical protein
MGADNPAQIGADDPALGQNICQNIRSLNNPALGQNIRPKYPAPHLIDGGPLLSQNPGAGLSGPWTKYLANNLAPYPSDALIGSGASHPVGNPKRKV